MRRITRLVYVSRACFDSGNESDDSNNDIADIILKARVNNRKTKVSGALYFANGYFFQCLEGKEQSVNNLLDKIKDDTRHKDLKITYYKQVRRRLFNNWTMKHVPPCEEVERLTDKLGYKEFNPTHFTEYDVNLLIDLFTRLGDGSSHDSVLVENARFEVSWWRSLLQRLVTKETVN